MIRFSGKSVLKGIAIGRIYVYRKTEYLPIKIQIEDIKEELERFQIAVKKAKEHLEALYQNALESVGEEQAAAIISDVLAKEVEFFSIGTNDLTQYTLAIDRQNQILESIYDSHHKAVLKLIHMTVENGHKENIWVGICGELAGDYSLTRTFVDMGVDELSVAPGYVLGLRKTIREI